jgi:hypothetical protein
MVDATTRAEIWDAKAMSPEEREILIERLARENAEARERIEALRIKREENPYEYDLADRRLTDDPSDLCFTAAVEPAEDPPVEKSNGNGLLIYRMTENARTSAPAPDTDWSAWQGWLDGNLNVLRAEVGDTISKALGIALASTRKEMQAEFECKLAALKAENVELRSMLADVLTRFNAVENVVQTLAPDFKAESGVRDGLVRAFELQIAELRGRVSAVLRDYAT